MVLNTPASASASASGPAQPAELELDIATGALGDYEHEAGDRGDDGEEVEAEEIITINGVTVEKRTALCRAEGGRQEERWLVQCPNTRDHPNCSKSRSIILDFKNFGKDGCRYYLETWLSKAYDPA